MINKYKQFSSQPRIAAITMAPSPFVTSIEICFEITEKELRDFLETITNNKLGNIYIPIELLKESETLNRQWYEILIESASDEEIRVSEIWRDNTSSALNPISAILMLRVLCKQHKIPAGVYKIFKDS